MWVGAVLMLGGMLTGFAFASKVDAMADAKWWDLMTAFGTVGAVAWAVLATFRVEARQHKEARARAQLASVSLFAKLSSSAAVVEAHHNVWIKNEFSALLDHGYRLKCRDHFQSVVNSIAREDVLAMHVAPGNCAKHLTRGLATLELLVEVLAFEVPPEKRPATVRLLGTVAADFTTVRQICKKEGAW
ncbi:hypothetical protein AXY46_22835 [Achromobacter xylosoxidans]|nr:hypothetical protein AXY46_22835 [Achromobacter xylosoxidans]